MPQKRRSLGNYLRERILRLGQLILLAAVLVAAGGFSAYLGMRFAVRSTEVEVPAIVGLSAEEAERRLAAVELNLLVAGKRYDPQVSEGAIISQNPLGGRRSKANREVQAVVSLGPRVNPVPNLLGATERAARVMALESDYELGNISRIGLSSADRDTVVLQYPSPDAAEAGDPRIDILVLSPSPRQYVMPDLTGQTLNRVVLFFERHGFRIDRINYRPYPGATRGTVVKQFPEPGHALSEGDSIHLEVTR